MHPIINIATRAARKAGDFIVRSLDRADDFTVTEKLANDFVTEIDQKAELIIIQTIQKSYPHHAILAEEHGLIDGAEYTWVIDPLDGTANFIHKIPHFAIAIAIQKDGITEHGVIYDPVRDELFTASRGSGAMLNNYRIRVSRQTKMQYALLATGFPFRHRSRLETYLQTLNTIYKDVSDIRRCGTASLDCAYVAAGRFDGYWEMSLKSWDIAAGALMIQEAGGFVTDFKGQDGYLESGDIVCGNPHIQPALLKAIRSHNA